ncbi:cyclohexanone monooxygenase [Moelleriella libera RCEF 2490]|uniref:Cyclohexanone monooxygenase n=1 Tax=Moelleriella libera RCEF 2490 TaxID=1081109 RepID=A0A166U5X2_9HYPO|nr:cyclohexanone monooxygenase [Moelleriella libera RCEF 2490]
MAVGQAGQSGASLSDLPSLNEKYLQESQKRFRQDGLSQYVELDAAASERLTGLAKDPWVDHEDLNARSPNLKDGDHVKFFILGAGYGGLAYGALLVEGGISPHDIRLVDIAGGFGGTWYWNRYPGVMCDTESYIYMPLLEETGYMPQHRYAYGPELRQHAVNIAIKWGLHDCGVFRTQAHAFDWNDDEKRWKVVLEQDRGLHEPPVDMSVTAQFVILAGGIFARPKTPRGGETESFRGQMMHTSRWNYDVSGGSPQDWTLTGLQGKKVGIVGTGATAIQCVPELAKWAGSLHVFQRTPSSVDERGQAPTDLAAWEEMTAEKGWWRTRNKNFCGVMSGYSSVGQNIPKERWLESKSYKYVVGGKHDKPLTVDQVPELINKALVDDKPHTDRIRGRVDKVVRNDKNTAEALKAWYPTWCKRPCFHDDYLPTFNLPHVKLVDTSPQGIEGVNENGIIAGGTQYDLDVIVWATGFRPFVNNCEPSMRIGSTITAKGSTLADLWQKLGPSTLHGLVSPWMPNLLLSGPPQAGVCANHGLMLDAMARHGVYIMLQTLKRAEEPDRATFRASTEAAEAWSCALAARATFMSPGAVCGPSYLNMEGALRDLPPEELMRQARAVVHPEGAIAYMDALEQWRAEGNLQGLEIF